ncbi:hypothetical protein MVEN_02509200 [Mycena venus]|uniref:Uncharacterized protein n=1 Tax=Mycena venus TaxID=2733690 RepID=A0A8H6WTZ0_9AGAR|nr:hypothetical protein MVEN_02509200 [Mycena venus]
MPKRLPEEAPKDWDLRGPFTTYPRCEQWEAERVPKMLAELRMYRLSWNIRRKPDWQRKASDPKILAKWRREVLEQQSKIKLDKKMTKKMVDYVLDELTGYAKIADNERGIERGCFDAIWYSDKLISKDVTERLKIAVSVLENVPETEKDWHPGSNNQVLDLVHPSLYCIVYGRTDAYLPDKPRVSENLFPMIVPTFNEGTDEWSVQVVDWSISTAYCWLPSDFSIGKDGSVKLVSPYINNLNPAKHQSLYRIIEEVLSGFIPMFDRVLGDIDRQNPLNDDSERLEHMYCVWGDALHEDDRPSYEAYLESLESSISNGEDCDISEEDWYDSQKTLPEASTYEGQLEDTLSPITLRGRTIQSIIKLANIHLIPENPKYRGGSWHVEGMANESIVASGIYYYDEDNITETKLSFRVSTSEPGEHSRNDHECAMIQYGISTYEYLSYDSDLGLIDWNFRYDDCVQEIGEMVTKAGRALSWPNAFQHCVSSFKLSDRSKPGHRKILAIFLVDPTIDPIPSATNVPPQQSEWACEALQELLTDNRSLVSRLPQELVDLIMEQLRASAMTLKEAESYRLKLMKERTVFVETHSDKAYGVKFNLCEH